MKYRVIYRDGEEGRLHRDCKICREINRNVIEPVAVFLPLGKELRDLSQEELENFDTCLFHCEKENEIWIENLEEYQEWKRKQEKNEIANPFFQIKWNRILFDEFWRRIRAYRFAVDYIDFYDPDPHKIIARIREHFPYLSGLSIPNVEVQLITHYTERLKNKEIKSYNLHFASLK